MPLSRVQPEHYSTLLAAKSERLQQLMADFKPPMLSVYPSPSLHFRMRAEFKFWHQGDDCYYVMFKREQPERPVKITDFPIGSVQLNDLMQRILAAIKDNALLRSKLFQVEFLTTLSQQALVTLIYHKPLDESWQQQARELEQQLGIHIIGRSKKQRLVLSQDFVIEQLQVHGEQYHFQQVENSFTQPNATINQTMLGWAVDNSRHLGGALLELYCGNGNFTVLLAPHFEKVLATEISKTSVRSAQLNFTANGVDNVTIARMSSEELSSALKGEREYRRLKGVDLDSYSFSTVFVDPPRAGLDPLTESLVAGFDNIIYISCNPDTLHNNLTQLCQSHDIKAFALFDQFPYTDHIETGVVLQRKKEPRQ